MRVAPGTITVATTGGSVGGLLEGTSNVGSANVGCRLDSVAGGVIAAIVPATIDATAAGELVGATELAQAADKIASTRADTNTGDDLRIAGTPGTNLGMAFGFGKAVAGTIR